MIQSSLTGKCQPYCLIRGKYRDFPYGTTIMYPIYPVSWAGDLGPLFAGLGTPICEIGPHLRGIGSPYTRDWSPIHGIGVGSPAYMVSDPSLAGSYPSYHGYGSPHERMKPLSRGDRSPGFHPLYRSFVRAIPDMQGSHTLGFFTVYTGSR